MGDRALPRVNKLVTARKQNYEYALHKQHVRVKNHAVDTAEPRRYTHLENNMKRKQIEAENMKNRERENLFLLEKMRKIMLEPQMDMVPPFQKGSLNSDARKKEMTKIMYENEALLKRIQQRGSNYSLKKWNKERRDQEMLISNISEFPPPQTRYRNGIVPPLSGRVNGGRPETPRSRTVPNTSRETVSQKDLISERVCIFSRAGLDLGGVVSVLSVYECPDPFRLEFVAVCGDNRSNRKPVMITFSELHARFSSQPHLLKPDNTDQLVLEIAQLLCWGRDPRDPQMMQIMFRPEKPPSAPNGRSRPQRPTSQPKPTIPAPAENTIPSASADEPALTEEDVALSDESGEVEDDGNPGDVEEDANLETEQAFSEEENIYAEEDNENKDPRGENLLMKLSVACSNMPSDDCSLEVLIKDETEPETAFKEIAQTNQKGGEAGSLQVVDKICVESYQNIDRDLKFIVSCVGQAVGEVSVSLNMFLALPNGTLELKLLDISSGFPVKSQSGANSTVLVSAAGDGDGEATATAAAPPTQSVAATEATATETPASPATKTEATAAMTTTTTLAAETPATPTTAAAAGPTAAS